LSEAQSAEPYHLPTFYNDFVVPQAASWNLIKTRFWQPGNIDLLNVYNLDNPVFGQRQHELLRDMTNRLWHHGLHTAPGTFWTGDIGRLDAFWTNANGAQGQKTTLVAMRNPASFADVKWKADLVHGVQTVCMLPKKINYYHAVTAGGWQQKGFQNQHLDNFALKFNMKSGGHDFVFDPAMLSSLLGSEQDTTVIFGADVAHPPSGAFQGVPSVAAVVASCDNQFQNYPASMRLQAGGEEVSTWSM
jgi:hypothetical protein